MISNTTKITDLQTKKLDKSSFDQEVLKLKDYVNESHITSTTQPKDEFRYLMEDVDESSSEYGIEVTGITGFSSSPHHFNKKAYDLKISKNSLL